MLCRFIVSIAAQPDYSDVPYGTKSWQLTDVYLTQAENPPVVLLVHGGGWNQGDKTDEKYLKLSNTLREYGCLVYNANYILSDSPSYEGFPQQLADILTLYRWIQTQGKTAYGGDTSTIILMGYSAGAHIVTLFSLYHRQLDLAEPAIHPAAVIGIGGVYSFDCLTDDGVVRLVYRMLGDSSLWELAQPVNQVKYATPALYVLFHNEFDKLVGGRQPELFESALLENGIQVLTHIYPDSNHAKINNNDLLPYIDLIINNKFACTPILAKATRQKQVVMLCGNCELLFPTGLAECAYCWSLYSMEGLTLAKGQGRGPLFFGDEMSRNKGLLLVDFPDCGQRLCYYVFPSAN